MCSGRIDPTFVLRAFSKGADGVFIGACHLGECNYMTHGNYHTLNMVLLWKKILEHIGLNPERLRIAFMSGAEASLFVENVNDFVKKVKELGPLGRSEGIDEKGLKRRLSTVTDLIPYIRLVERERLRAPVMSEEEYQKFFASEELNRLFSETIVEKLAVGQIISLLREKPLPTGEIAKVLGLTQSEVSRYLNSSSRQGLVRYDQSQKCFALA
jgi:F420-non-reducing hydrogenase iron-sulfur subunit